MKTKTTLIFALLLLGLSAAAEFKTVSRAYEIKLSNFRVPATPSSGVIFRECEECKPKLVRVTPNTLYEVNGKAVTLKEFRKNVFQIRDRASEWIVVMHHLESDTVIRVSVTI
jgi:hypothetical protein